MFKSFIFIDFCVEMAEAYLDPNQTSQMEPFAKILKAVNYFHKWSILDVWLSFKYSLEGFVKDAPREELAIVPVVECLTTTG